MSRFVDVLRPLSGRLDLPQPARSRVLLELAADMEDLYDVYAARGLDAETARTRVIEAFALSDDALAALCAVHRGPARRLLDRFSADTLARWEVSVLVSVTLLAAALCLGPLVRGRVVLAAGPFAWPVFLLALVAGVLALAKSYQLVLKQDHAPRRARRGLGALLRVSLALPCLGFAGSWLEALRQSRLVEPTPLFWALRSAALLQLALGLTVVSALAWYFLAARVGRIERDEASVLLDGGLPTIGSGPDPQCER